MRDITALLFRGPYHDGEPSQLREFIPAALGRLRLKSVIEEFASIAAEKNMPILIGHSVGGLIAQVLINRGIGSCAVCINSVAPNRMLAADWGFFKNSLAIANPLAGNEPFIMDAEGFHKNFANVMSRNESDEACMRRQRMIAGICSGIV